MNLRIVLAAIILAASLPAWSQALERDMQQLPPKYSGASASAIYNAITSQAKKLKLAKDEFETTENYASRMEGLSAPGIDLVNRIGFFIPQSKVKSDLKYDADRKEIMVAFKMRGPRFSKIKSTRLESKKVSSSRYIGSNAFGVKKEIYKLVTNQYGVQFDWTLERLQDTLYFQVGMDPDEARVEMKNIALLVSGRIAPPFVAEDMSHESATITYPYEVTDMDKLIILRDAELWLVNRVTGKVLARNRP